MLFLCLREYFEEEKKQLWTCILHHNGADRPAHQPPSDQKPNCYPKSMIHSDNFGKYSIITHMFHSCVLWSWPFIDLIYKPHFGLHAKNLKSWEEIVTVSLEAESWWFSNVDFLIKVRREADSKRLEQYGWTSWCKTNEDVFAFNSGICYSFILQ